MKLYTEEQIREVCMSIDTNFYISDLYIDTQIKLLTPIELPSDEDLDKWIVNHDYEFSKVDIQTTKWVIEKIKQQDK